MKKPRITELSTPTNARNKPSSVEEQFNQMTQPKCRRCGIALYGKNAIDVGYCLDCYAEINSDDDTPGEYEYGG